MDIRAPRVMSGRQPELLNSYGDSFTATALAPLMVVLSTQL